MTAIGIRIGTAGWSVPARYAAQFPAEGSHLERYALRMTAVEINSSFYKPHRRETYDRWAASVPDGFRFAVKAPKALTHEKRLKDADDVIAAFADQLGGLGEKLGVVLVQLPPSLAFAPQAADRAFAALAGRIDAPLALEPRHATWFAPEVGDWLAERRIARVAADPLPKGVPESGAAPGGWRGLAYYRWHGSPRIYYSEYDAAALAGLAARLRTHMAAGQAAWCVFDNTAAFAALGNALALADAVSAG